MVIAALWVVVALLLVFCVIVGCVLSSVSDKLETLKHLHLNLDADMERRFGRVGGVEVLRGKLESLKSEVDGRLSLVWEHVKEIKAVANVGVNDLHALCDRVAAVEKDASDRSKQTSLVYKGLPPDRRMYDVDWNKSGIELKPFQVSGWDPAKGESKSVIAGFNSKLVTRMDELKPKVSSAGDDHRAAEVLPGSPAATIGSQANNSSALLEKMGPKPADLLRLFNAPPIICAEGAVLVKRKGV